MCLNEPIECPPGQTCNRENGECEVSCHADLDGDGAVTAADLAMLLGSWGVCPGCPADFDGDGSVTAGDLAQLLGAWGPCS